MKMTSLHSCKIPSTAWQVQLHRDWKLCPCVQSWAPSTYTQPRGSSSVSEQRFLPLTSVQGARIKHKSELLHFFLMETSPGRLTCGGAGCVPLLGSGEREKPFILQEAGSESLSPENTACGSQTAGCRVTACRAIAGSS